MRYFLIYILSALPFFALSQVTLPDDVARFYLDRHFFAKNLEERNKLLTLLAESQDKTINKQDSLIQNYATSEAVHTLLDNNLRLQVEAGDKEIRSLHKKLRQQRILMIVGIVIFTLITL